MDKDLDLQQLKIEWKNKKTALNAYDFMKNKGLDVEIERLEVLKSVNKLVNLMKEKDALFNEE